MTTKLRATVLCSGDSSALQSLVELSPQLPITLELIITDKAGDDNIYLSNIYGIPSSEYDKLKYKNSLDFETSILNELIDKKIDVLIILGINYEFELPNLFNYYNCRIFELFSPLFEFQSDDSNTAESSLNSRHSECTIAACLLVDSSIVGKINLVRTYIPIFRKSDTIEILKNRIRAIEKLTIVAGIETAYLSRWSKLAN